MSFGDEKKKCWWFWMWQALDKTTNTLTTRKGYFVSFHSAVASGMFAQIINFWLVWLCKAWHQCRRNFLQFKSSKWNKIYFFNISKFWLSHFYVKAQNIFEFSSQLKEIFKQPSMVDFFLLLPSPETSYRTFIVSPLFTYCSLIVPAIGRI